MELKENSQKDRILRMLQEKYPNYHPIVALADIAMATDDKGLNTADIRTQADCHKTILKYVEPELKSIEVKGKMKNDFGTLRVVLAEDSDDDSEPDGSSIEGEGMDQVPEQDMV